MSYARSPRLVCSTTIGTRAIAGNPFRQSYGYGRRSSSGQGYSSAPTAEPRSGRALIKVVQGFLVAKPFAHALQSAVIGKLFAHSLNGLPRLLRQALDFDVQIGIVGLDLFPIGDLFQDQGCLYFAQGSITLREPQAAKVHLPHVFRTHALCREGAESTFQARRDLLIYK